MGQTDGLRQDLKDAIGEQVEIKLKLLQHERRRVADRVKKLDEQIKRLGGDRQEKIEAQIRLLTKNLNRSKAKSQAKVRNAQK